MGGGGEGGRSDYERLIQNYQLENITQTVTVHTYLQK